MDLRTKMAARFLVSKEKFSDLTGNEQLWKLKSARDTKIYRLMTTILKEDLPRMRLNPKQKAKTLEIIGKVVFRMGHLNDFRNGKLAVFEHKLKGCSMKKLQRLLLIDGCFDDEMFWGFGSYDEVLK